MVTIAERAYYTRRAPEYDDWYLGTGLYAARHRPGWHEEVEALKTVVACLHAGKFLDVACGTGFLTRLLKGRVVAIDQSPAMLRIARLRLPQGSVLQGDAFRLPFAAGSFDILLTGHFYGHLEEPDRTRFLAEARRVARELVIIDAALRPDIPAELIQERELNDGSRHTVFKRYFTPAQLLAELDGGTILHAGDWFVAVRSPAQGI
ncbi:MAG: hypothetical protein C5B51_01320 [Terriglobia bacterium]|nr:MAG: hypothetical protein C5B51_01320 [Terriglobia bacterium]